jgi:hypothetical protein
MQGRPTGALPDLAGARRERGSDSAGGSSRILHGLEAAFELARDRHFACLHLRSAGRERAPARLSVNFER